MHAYIPLLNTTRHLAPQFKGKERSVDEIKARYYAIARQLLIGREGGSQHVANHTLVKHPFNLQYEVNRKKGMDLVMANRDITIVRQRCCPCVPHMHACATNHTMWCMHTPASMCNSAG